MGFKEDKPKSLLSVEADPKTKKGKAKNWLTGILYLFPHKAFGFDICPAAERAQCAEPCLNLAGKGAMTKMCIRDSMWGEHEGWPVEDWQRAVSEDETRLGYWEWVEANVDLYGDYLDEEETEEEAEE